MVVVGIDLQNHVGMNIFPEREGERHFFVGMTKSNIASEMEGYRN